MGTIHINGGNPPTTRHVWNVLVINIDFDSPVPAFIERLREQSAARTSHVMSEDNASVTRESLAQNENVEIGTDVETQTDNASVTRESLAQNVVSNSREAITVDCSECKKREKKQKRYFQLFWSNVHLEISTEKKHQPGRTLSDVIINYRKQVARVKKKKSSGRPRVSEEAVDRARESIVQSPRMSTRVATCKRIIPQKSVQKILRDKCNDRN
ncbi:hypothetical protein TNCV_135841 [Trichonephila clavipes]|nr:hypothetical protein TNCV_135841 [Trichonephila clavipes]